MAQTINRLTPSGRSQIERKIARLEEKLAELDFALQGTFDNSGILDEEYLDTLEMKAHTEQELRSLQNLLDNAQLIVEIESSSTVSLGSTVRLENHEVCYTFRIVSPMEADPLAGWLSEESPIGSVIMGRECGETVIVQLPKGEIELRIMEIS